MIRNGETLAIWGVPAQVSDFVGNWISFAARINLLQMRSAFVGGISALGSIASGTHSETTTLWDVFNAYQAGGATESDVMFYLLGAEERTLKLSNEGDQTSGTAEAKANLRTSFQDLSHLTRRKC
jgi:hypothetical protein